MLAAEGVVDMYSDFAGEYDGVVLGEYKYVAHQVVGRKMISLIPSLRAAVLNKTAIPSTPVTIIDLGCGTGLSSSEFFKLPRTVCSVTGVDVTPAMIDKARERPYSSLAVQSLEETLKWSTGSFDVAIMLGVMEFIRDPPSLFKEIHRILRPSSLPSPSSGDTSVAAVSSSSSSQPLTAPSSEAKTDTKVAATAAVTSTQSYFAFTLPMTISAKLEKRYSIKTFEAASIATLLPLCGFTVVDTGICHGYTLNGSTTVQYTYFICHRNNQTLSTAPSLPSSSAVSSPASSSSSSSSGAVVAPSTPPVTSSAKKSAKKKKSAS